MVGEFGISFSACRLCLCTHAPVTYKILCISVGDYGQLGKHKVPHHAGQWHGPMLKHIAPLARSATSTPPRSILQGERMSLRRLPSLPSGSTGHAYAYNETRKRQMQYQETFTRKLATHIHLPSAAGQIKQKRHLEFPKSLQILSESLTGKLLHGVLVSLRCFFYLPFLREQMGLTHNF